jgi:hypothetical protein
VERNQRHEGSSLSRSKVSIMKSSRVLAFVAVVFFAFASGCEAQPAPRAPASAGAEITRAAAIRTARSDAAARFGVDWVATVAAQNFGRFWVVELRAQSGAGVRYAISTNDGSIRERSLFQ